MIETAHRRRDHVAFTAATFGLLVSGALLGAAPAYADPAAASVTVNLAVVAPAAPAAAAAESAHRPGIVIHEGVVTMLPVGDSAHSKYFGESRPATETDARPAQTFAAAGSPLSNNAITNVTTVSVVVHTQSSREAASSQGAAPSKEENCLATAVYFEARGESRDGQKAVAEVVLARVRAPNRPKTICGVVYEGVGRGRGCQFSFACDGSGNVVRDSTAWECAQEIANNELNGGDDESITHGATYYHANYVRPSWASRMIKVATVGAHIFYKPRNT